MNETDLKNKIDTFMFEVIRKNPNESVFHQAVYEVAEAIIPFIEKNPKYQGKRLLERISEPERVIMFKVSWKNDRGEVQVNRGYRIEMNSALGPYKGGLRFSSVRKIFQGDRIHNLHYYRKTKLGSPPQCFTISLIISSSNSKDILLTAVL